MRKIGIAILIVIILTIFLLWLQSFNPRALKTGGIVASGGIEDSCKKVSAETKYLSDQVKSLWDAIHHEESNNIHALQEYPRVEGLWENSYWRCRNLQNSGMCPNMTCQGF